MIWKPPSSPSLSTNAQCATAWSRPRLREFLQAGLLRAAPAPETVIVDEPDDLPRLARLHHELGLAPEALDVILAMRQRLVQPSGSIER